MKKSIKSAVAFLAAVVVICGLSIYNNRQYVNAQTEVKPSLTIENTTPLELKDVKVQMNHDRTVNVGTIGKNASVEVPLEEDADPVVVTKIQGKTSMNGKFAGTVRGWIKNDAKIKVHLDDEMKAYVSSNVEEE